MTWWTGALPGDEPRCKELVASAEDLERRALEMRDRAAGMKKEAADLQQQAEQMKATVRRARRELGYTKAPEKSRMVVVPSPDAPSTDPEEERLRVDENRRRSCTSKARYRTLGGAGDAAKYIRTQRDVELRIYKCGFCGGYHFTHMKLEDVADRAAS